MSLPYWHKEIRRMVEETVLHTKVARDIVRKAGVRVPPPSAGGDGVCVLSCATDPYINAARPFAGIYSHFDWDLPESFDWWPEGFSPGPWSSTTDLSLATEMQNRWYVVPGRANADANIRVQASVDGTSWEYATDGPDDWRYRGASVNCAGWLTYNESNEPYQNYPSFYQDREGATDAIPAGITRSEWQPIKSEFRAMEVHLRWKMEWSHTFDSDPYYLTFDELGVGYGEVRVR